MSHSNHKKSRKGKRSRNSARRAELCARFGVSVGATHEEFGVIVHRSERTVSRYVERGLPTIVPGLIDVPAGLEWLKKHGVKHSKTPERLGRPRNVDRGIRRDRDGGDR